MVDYRKLYEQCKSYSILFVEDYAPLPKKVIEILEDYFSIVISTVDGHEGWLEYQKYHKEHHKYVDIVLTDIGMPRKNGLELSKNIRALHPTQTIVVLSAYKESE